MYNTHTSRTFTQMPWQQRKRWRVYTDIKEEGCEREKENLEDRKANSAVEVAGFTDIRDIRSVMLL